MPRKPIISLIGAGNLARALAPALRQAGYPVDEIVSRDRPESQRRARTLARRVSARPATPNTAELTAPIVWLCVTDDAIAPCTRSLARSRNWRGRVVLHSSGALSSDLLAPLRRRGAAVGSLHPMMTFTPGSVSSLAGITFAVEGDPAAVRAARAIARALGGHVLAIRKQNKALYHSWGSFASPLVVATLALAEEIAVHAGVPRSRLRSTMTPIILRTLQNYLQRGRAAAFSGPLVRGDVTTIRHHLRDLKRVPGAREVYVALVRSALRTLPVKNRAAIRRLLG